jgi:peptide/nickel transport system ATP-binding protein
MLTVENVSKIYRVGTFGGGELHAVRDVSFSIPPGEVVSLIGESGSGKSTLGKLILRLTPVSRGRITFAGEDITPRRGAALKDYYRHVQGVFQDPFSSYNPIFKADRIFQVIHDEFFPSLAAEEWAAKLEAALACVGLNPGHVLRKYPHQLSGGQLQRFLIARALLLDSDFLVADEIISMLDASTRIDVLNLLGELKGQGLGVLFITHDLSLGYYISDRAVILYRGCVVEIGATDRIYHQPRHPYTQMLMQSVPRLDARWDAVPGESDAPARPAPPALQGCPYYSRCPVAIPGQCDLHRPPLVDLETDHAAACWLTAPPPPRSLP